MNDYIYSRRKWLRERYSVGDLTATQLKDIYNERFKENRSLSSIYNQLEGISPKRWTNEQLSWLKRNRGNLKKICNEFNERFGTYRSYEALKNKTYEIRKELREKYGEEMEICSRTE